MRGKIRRFLIYILTFTISMSVGVSADTVGVNKTETSEEIVKEVEVSQEPQEQEKLEETEIPKESETAEEVEIPKEPETPKEPENQEQTKPVEVEKPTDAELDESTDLPEDLEKDSEKDLKEIIEEKNKNKTVNLSAELVTDKKAINGESLNYEVILKNSGEVDIEDIRVVDDLDLDRKVEQIKAGEPITIKESFDIDRFNKLEEIGNKIRITGRVDGREISLAVSFKLEIEIPKGSITITNEVAGSTEKDQMFDIFIEGPNNSLHVISLKKGESKQVDNIWLGDYEISSKPPANYRVEKNKIRVKLTKDNPNESNLIVNHTKENDGWFYNYNRKVSLGEIITKDMLVVGKVIYKFEGEENRVDEISFEIAGSVVETNKEEKEVDEESEPEEVEAAEDPVK